ncbi:MAG TPA: deoxyribonuclease IV [bacterium]|nr:deoxyribonuclease IV [bacterium]
MKTVKIPRPRLLGAHCSIAGGLSNAPRTGGEIGCTAIQLFTGSNRQWRTRPISKGEAEEFAREMGAGGVHLAFAHAMYLINLAAPDSSIFKKSVRAMASELERADRLGLPFVVIHPGSPKDRGRDWGVRRASEAIERVFDLVPEAKARIALETTAGAGSSLGGTFEELSAIMGGVGASERLCVCFDTCHAFAAGYDFRRRESYESMWRLFDEWIGLEKLCAIHLNDCLGECGSHLDRHTHIGKGNIGLSGFRLIMKDKRLTRIPMVLETPKGEDSIGSDRSNIRTLIKLALD